MSVVVWSKTMTGRRRAATSWPQCGRCSNRAGLLSQVALSPIQGHDVALWRPLLEQAPVLRAGDLRREDRGLLDGATLSPMQRQRQVEVITPLKATM